MIDDAAPPQEDPEPDTDPKLESQVVDSPKKYNLEEIKHQIHVRQRISEQYKDRMK